MTTCMIRRAAFFSLSLFLLSHPLAGSPHLVCIEDLGRHDDKNGEQDDPKRFACRLLETILLADRAGI